MNDARGWKSAVKKSIRDFHNDPTVGGFLNPAASLLENKSSNLLEIRFQSTRTKEAEFRYYRTTGNV